MFLYTYIYYSHGINLQDETEHQHNKCHSKIELNLLSVNGNLLLTCLLQCVLHNFDITMNTII